MKHQFSPALLDKNNKLYYVHHYLCDTGCKYNLIKESYFNCIKRKLGAETRPCEQEFCSVDSNSKTMIANEMCLLKVNINGTETNDIFYVINGIDINIVFGLVLMIESGIQFCDKFGTSLQISDHKDFKYIS